MFTGLIEAIGRVVALRRSDGGLDLTVDLPAAFDDVEVGASIALSGCCTTVTAITSRGPAYAADFHMVPETLDKTSFGDVVVGQRLNLERALRADQRLGGHFVQGHVDGLAQVAEIVERPDGWDIDFEVAAGLARDCVPKGSIAVDGISLTIAKLVQDPGAGATVRFGVAVIPHTLAHTTLADRRVGDRVHIEVDVLAKYVERLVAPRV